MKTKFTLCILLLCLTASLPSWAGGPASGSATMQASATLSDEEARILTWMREEEKVARDVYLSSYRKWKAQVFKQIAESEQRHMDAILNKLNMFGLPDPALPVEGQFTNPDLQALYNQLSAESNVSYLDALRVGATIEDTDIRDLMAAIAATNNLAVKTTYESLLEGSKNHLRAFVGLLRKLGTDYTPQFISQELFDAIMAV